MPSVSSEITPLKKVIIHRPDDGIELVTPNNALEFLYDDIVFLPLMREEHAIFTDLLELFIGKENVLDTQTMLWEVISTQNEARLKLLDYVFDWEECNEDDKKILSNLPSKDLVYTLFTGVLKESRQPIFSPLPNYIFTRDIGVVVNDHVIICQAAMEPRSRENILTRCIVYYHELFKYFVHDDKIIDLTKEGGDVTMEGGDVMVYDKDHLLVGCSSRTSEKALDILVQKLFEKNVVNNVVRIDIPKQRSSMHIDTIFTQISKNEFVVYAPHVISESSLQVTRYTKGTAAPERFKSLKDFFLSVNPDTDFIFCGNGEFPHDEREQWTDGCNLVAIRDGLAIAYNRNIKTSLALEQKGYNVVDAETFVQACKERIVHPDKVERTIFTIPATELSRARGGPHCMSFPLERE